MRRVGGSIAEGVRIALDSLRANLFRSSLTILGVGIGVAVVVLMAGLITGIRTAVQEGIESLLFSQLAFVNSVLSHSILPHS
jgi:hypothetical protein